MSRQLIALATAAAIAISGFAAVPAEAKGKDAIKILLGVAAVGLLLNQMNQGKARASTVLPPPDRWDNEYDDGYSQPTSGRLIPSECLMDVTVNGRLREVVSSRCARELGFAQQLPADCAFEVRTGAGSRSVYGPQCLRDYGYRIEAARY